MKLITRPHGKEWSRGGGVMTASSSNGRWVIFMSHARDMASTARFGGYFIADTRKGKASHIAFAGPTIYGNGSGRPQDYYFRGISDDGNRVLYEYSRDSTLWLWDRPTGARTQLATDVLVLESQLDPSGRYAFYATGEANPAGDPPPIYRMDLSNHQTMNVVSTPDGHRIGDDSDHLCAVANHGDTVVFETLDAIYVHTLSTGAIAQFSSPEGTCAAVSQNGRIVGYTTQQGKATQAHVRDMQTGRDQVFKIPHMKWSQLRSISADGRVVTVGSTLNLPPAQLPRSRDWIFEVGESRGTPVPTPAQARPTQTGWNTVYARATGNGRSFIVDATAEGPDIDIATSDVFLWRPRR